MILTDLQQKIIRYLDSSATGKIKTDYSIYRTAVGYDMTGYKINIANRVAAQLYTIFKIQNKLPLNYPISDNDRSEFEKWIRELIKSQKIILRSNAKKE